MRKLLKQVSDRIGGFIAGRDHVALVLQTPPSDGVPLLKILEELEETSRSDLYWTFTDNFTTPEEYANAVVQGFAGRHQAIRAAMEKAKLPPWPPVPAPLLSSPMGPAKRLRQLAVFSRELLPVPNGGNNVWILFPLEVSDTVAFDGLMRGLVEHQFPLPWCHHLRFIVREEPGALEHLPMLSGMPRIDRYRPDLSIDAIQKSLEEEAADESLPLAERMAPIPIMAGNDFALGRYPEALQKYEMMLQYHAPMNNLPLAAVALNGMGEVYQRMGNLKEANDCYEAALIPASHGEHPPIPVFLNVVANLGNLCVEQMRWADGEAYYDMAQQLATAARNPASKIGALENRGYCQQQQGKVEEAVQSWNDATVIAAQLEDVYACRRLLQRLERYYAQAAGDAARLEELRGQLAALNAQ